MKNVNIKFMYSSDSDNFAESFYIPLLKSCDVYLRAVGYFSSSILKGISEGIEDLVKRDGKINIICSPNLMARDIEKIEQGYNRRDVINDRITAMIKDSSAGEYKDISWLIKHKILDIKVVVGLIDKNMLYHEKFGVFLKDENKVVFWGSSNETQNALEKNYESFTAMKSWERPEECNLFEEKFYNIWNGNNTLLDTYDFPEAAKKELLKRYTPETFSPKPDNKWSFQEKAIENFIENDHKLMYEMATGTGKTRTALKTIKNVYESNNQVLPIILVNQVDLMYQWEVAVKDFFGIKPILIGDSNSFQSDIENNITLRKFNQYEFNIIIAVDKSYRSHFLSYVKEYEIKNIFIVYDEAHNITQGILSDLPEAEYRLALTATLERPNEFEETAIRHYFGNKSFVFGIEDAIDLGVLTRYEYKLELVEMTDYEYDRFIFYTKKMMNIYGNKELSENEKNRLVKENAQMRAVYVKKMENKTHALVNLLNKLSDINRTVIYCGSGQNSEGDSIIDEISNMISTDVNDETRISHYTYRQSKDRPQILDYFKEGFYDVLIAMKCLDEGVDIPMLENLYILASDKSVKQTIQRRGRVMRSFNNKEKCFITDFVAIPPGGTPGGFAKSLLKIEMERIKEYNSIAINKKSNDLIIEELKDKYMEGEDDEREEVGRDNV